MQNTSGTSTGEKLLEMYTLLFEHFGPQNWWPGETALEVMVGAVLTQNTNWKNVEKAVNNLKRRGLLSIEELHSAPVEDLAGEIRPAGYFNIKAARLKNLTALLMEWCGGDLSLLFHEDTRALRSRLLGVKGIGPETADSILLYAFNRPVFVVDAYTYRILFRHGMAEEQASYEDLQDLFESHLVEDARLFNEFHALIVTTGKDYCKKRPLCEACPLGTWER